MGFWETVETISNFMTLILYFGLWIAAAVYLVKGNLWRGFVCFALTKGVFAFIIVNEVYDYLGLGD